ncbi:anti-phage protein KwaA [Pectobacterium sp. B2J-2]|uniref:anti-phage protein KwaA n=1 Tax=Pectobacterium sp. B2J-2 TaxID=3385372 RepID=UPI0038FCFAA4
MDSRPYLKTVLYILSLWLLFLSLLIMSFDKVLIKNLWDYVFTENFTFPISSLRVRNIVFIVSLVFIFIGAIILIILANSFGSGWSVACTVSDISNENHEHLEFLTTYIMPLVFTDVDSKRTVLNLGLMIFVIGAIYVKTNRFYSNPSLAILGFRIYKANVHDRGVKKCTIICRGVLKNTDSIKYIKIDDETYLAKII